MEVGLDIYLIQHAESVSEKEDPERPVSEEGKATMEKIGSLAARLGINPDIAAGKRLNLLPVMRSFAPRYYIVRIVKLIRAE